MKNIKKYLLITLGLLLSLIGNTQSLSLSDGLQVHYKFNSSLDDESTNSNDLTAVNGNPSYNVIYQNEEEIEFNGNSAFRSKSNLNTFNYNASAITMWVKTSQNQGYNQTIIQGAYLGFGIHIEANTGKIGGFFNGNSSGSYSSNIVITDGKWHHIVFQCNGNEMFVYIDGILDGSLPTVMLTGDNKIFIGNSNSGNNTFYGSINELRIYDRLLSNCEIKELYRHLVATVDASNGNSVAPNDLIVQEKICNQSNLSKVKVYPNPPVGNFVIEFENTENLEFLTISDVIGQQLLQKNINELEKIELNIEFLESGFYYITIYGKHEIKTIQVLKP